MPNTASLTFRLFGVDVTARRTIDAVGLSALTSAKSLEVGGTAAAKWAAIITGAGAASVAAGGAIGVGLVGAVGAVGIAFAAQADKVKKSWGDLGSYLKTQSVAMTGPIQNVLVGLSGYVRSAFNAMKPDIAHLFSAVAPLVDLLGRGLVDAATSLTATLSDLFSSVRPLVTILAQHLEPLAESLGDTLSNILGPATQSSRAFGLIFDTLEQLLPILGEVLGSFIRLGAQIMPALGPVLIQIARILSDTLAKILPTIGKALVDLLPSISIVLKGLATAVQALAPVLPTIAHAFTQLVSAIAPMIPQILSYLTPAIVALLPPLLELFKALTPLIPPILKILSAFLPLGPVIIKAATAIAQALLPALLPFLTLVAKLVQQFAGALMTAIIDSTPALIDLAKSFGEILTAVTPLLPSLVKLLLAFAPLIPVVAQVASVLAKILVPIIRDVVVPVLNFLVRTQTTVVNAIVGSIVWLSKNWQAVWNSIAGFTTRIMNDIKNIVMNAVNVIVRFFTQTIPRWFNAGRDLVLGLLNGAQSILKGLGGWLNSHILQPLLGFFRNAPSWLYNHGRNIVMGMLNGMASLLNGIGGWLNQHLFNPVTGFFRDAARWLYNHGRDLIFGLLNGMASVLGGIYNWIKDHVYNAIVGAIKGIFGIHSPSTVMAGLGSHMIEGLMKGLIFSSRNLPALLLKVFGGTTGLLKTIALSGLNELKNLFGAGLSFIGIGGSLSAPVKGVIQKYAKALLDARGWGGMWGAFNALVMGESGWNPRATNPQSGAYGIPQALPASKLDAYGNRNDPAVQLRWMVDYIASVYGNPANAYAKWLSRSPHWYDVPPGYGYDLPPGLSTMLNTTGRPERIVRAGGDGGTTIYNITVQGSLWSTRDAARELRNALNLDSRNNGGRSS